MKCTVLLLVFVLALVSCSNKEDHELTTDYWNKNDSIRVVTASDGTFLKITNQHGSPPPQIPTASDR